LATDLAILSSYPIRSSPGAPVHEDAECSPSASVRQKGESPAFILLKAATASPSRPPRLISCGRPISLICEWLAGVGFIYPPVLDDFSRYLLAWKLCARMSAGAVADALRLALAAAGLNQAGIAQRPRLLSDNAPTTFLYLRRAQMCRCVADPMFLGFSQQPARKYDPITR
jgi:transposase InsO family protein